MSKIFKLTNTGITLEPTLVEDTVVVVITSSIITVTGPGCKTPHDLKNMILDNVPCKVHVSMKGNNEILSALGITEETHYLDMIKKAIRLFTGEDKELTRVIKENLIPHEPDLPMVIEKGASIKEKITAVLKARNESKFIVFADKQIEVETLVKFSLDGACNVVVKDGTIISQMDENEWIMIVEQGLIEGLTVNEISIAVLLKQSRYKMQLSQSYVKLLDDGLDFNKLANLNRHLSGFLLVSVEDNVKETMLKMALNIIAPIHTS